MGIYLYKSYKLLKVGGVFYASNKIRNILLCFALLWIIWVPYTIVDIMYYDFGFPPSGFYVFYIYFAILTYGIGFFGFKINDQTYEKVAPPNTGKCIQKTKESKEMKSLASSIKTTMQEGKLYLDPNLSLSSFAHMIDLHPNKVSAIINSTLGYSFRDFINKYRVKEFEEQLAFYDLQSRTLLSLAMECGFNSKASFNRAFKKFNNCTPQEFVENYKKRGVKM
ncbi:helix-turn-helix domain-containing protein [Winogradskyella haliclonae]|nr:AraC family transcriptional regulator [Winogradskyella haliclonae]